MYNITNFIGTNITSNLTQAITKPSIYEYTTRPTVYSRTTGLTYDYYKTTTSAPTDSSWPSDSFLNWVVYPIAVIVCMIAFIRWIYDLVKGCGRKSTLQRGGGTAPSVFIVTPGVQGRQQDILRGRAVPGVPATLESGPPTPPPAYAVYEPSFSARPDASAPPSYSEAVKSSTLSNREEN